MRDTLKTIKEDEKCVQQLLDDVKKATLRLVGISKKSEYSKNGVKILFTKMIVENILNDVK